MTERYIIRNHLKHSTKRENNKNIKQKLRDKENKMKDITYVSLSVPEDKNKKNVEEEISVQIITQNFSDMLIDADPQNP